jgi:hypothetical protein
VQSSTTLLAITGTVILGVRPCWDLFYVCSKTVCVLGNGISSLMRGGFAFERT